MDNPGNDGQRGRFAAPVGTKDSENVSFLDQQGNAINSRDGAIGLGQVGCS